MYLDTDVTLAELKADDWLASAVDLAGVDDRLDHWCAVTRVTYNGISVS